MNPVESMVTSTSNRSYAFAFAITVGAVLFTFLVPLHCFRTVSCFEHDIAVLLDSGWRIIHGQIPHRDFYNHLGTELPFLMAVGIKTVGLTNAVAAASCIVYCFVAPALFLAGTARLSAFWLIVLQIWMCLYVVTQRPLGYSVVSLSPVMQYNRWFEALICLLFVFLFFQRRGESDTNKNQEQRVIAESVLVGLIIGLLAFGKVTYFVIALAALVFFLLSRQSNRFDTKYIIVAFVLTATALLMVFQVNISEILADYRMVSGAQSLALQITEMTSKIVGSYSVELMGKCEGIWLHLTFMVILLICNSRASEPMNSAKVTITSLFMLACGWSTYCTNSEIGDSQIAALVPLYIYCTLAPADKFLKATTVVQKCVRVGLLLLAITYPLILTAKDAASIYIAHDDMRKFETLSSESLQKNSLLGMILTGKYGPDYVQYVNSGIFLIKKHNLQRQRVQGLDFSNPFPIMLASDPPTGGAVTWHDEHTFTTSCYPSKQRAFGNAQVLLIPKPYRYPQFNGLATQQLLKVYGDFINEEFRFVDENDLWSLFVKK